MLAVPCLHNHDAFFFFFKSFFTKGVTALGISVMTRRGGKGLCCLLYSQSLERAGRAKRQEASLPASIHQCLCWHSCDLEQHSGASRCT